MPRIAVAVGAVGLIAFSIGFNTARYTVVWEMVGSMPQASQPKEAAQPEAVSHSAAPAQSAAVGPAPYDWAEENSDRDSPVENGWDDRPALDAEEPLDAEEAPAVQKDETEYEDPYDYGARPPEEVLPSIKYSARVDVAEAFGPPASGHGDLGGEIRRLPRVDRVTPLAEDRGSAGSLGDPIGVYAGNGS